METVKRVLLSEEERVPRTPIRNKAAAVLYRRSEGSRRSRRSLSFLAADMSDVSPLSSSASSGVYSPPPPSLDSVEKTTPSKAMTPLKGNFDQLLISQDSPKAVEETPRKRRSPRVKGVSPLREASRGIPAKSFYGPNAIKIPEDRSEIYRVVHAHVLESKKRVRTRLVLDDLLRNRKRVRSGGGSGRPHKKSRIASEKERLLQAPRLTPGSPLRKRRPKIPKTAPPRLKKEKTEKKTAPCNWEVFYSPSNGPRKFFSKRPKLSLNDSLLTPPSSHKKQRKLLNTTTPDIFLSPQKSESPSDDEGPLTAEVMDDLLSVLESPRKSAPPSSDSESSEESDSSPEDGLQVETPRSRYYPVFTNSTPVSSELEGKKSARKRILGLGMDQYQIDLGQNGLCETQCSQCGLVYSKGDPDDEKEHAKYHNNYNQLRFKGWKNEKVVGSFEGRDKVVCVDRYDAKSWWRKAETVVEIVDKELGFPEQPLHNLKFPKVYLYIKERTVVGCLVAERVCTGHRFFSGEVGLDICSEEEYPVKCGVNRIWVHHLHRRSGIASRLLDTLRRTFVFGCILRAEDLAFTIPTESGKNFISRYSGNKEFLVYIYRWPRYD